MPLRVLLITPVFYGVEKKIKSTLEELGYKVTWFENKTLNLDYHGTKSKLKFLRRIYFFLFFPHIRYIRKELNRIENKSFDILFSINCHAICPYLLRKLKSKNSDLFSVLYLWDALAMYNWKNELKQFTKVFTFDPEDSKECKVEYKPIFYISSSVSPCQEIGYDLFFAGKFNSFRSVMVDKILCNVEDSEISYFVKLWPAYKIYFHNSMVYKLLKLTKLKREWIKNYLLNFEALEGKLKKVYIQENWMSYEEMQKYMLNSNVILNLPFQSQKGYSYGLIEALANGKKVITTNSNIVRESFYNSNQIHILNLDNPEIDCGWIKEKSTFPVDNYFANLELSEWLKSIMNVRRA